MEDNLQALHSLISEIESHRTRIKKEKVTTAAQLHAELHDTVLGLLLDVASLTASEHASMRAYVHEEIEPVLQAAAGEDSSLLPEDSELIMKRLAGYRTVLVQMHEVSAADADKQAEIQAELEETDRAIALVSEITLEDEPDEGEEEEEEEDDEPEGEETLPQ